MSTRTRVLNFIQNHGILKSALRRGDAIWAQVRGLGKYKNLKKQTKGMLSPVVYKAIEDFSSRGVWLEIGGAFGTATSFLSRSDNKIIVIEKCEGGSRERYGSKEQNEEFLRENLKTYCKGDVVLHVGESKEGLVKELLDGIMIDADGRLDRDFGLYWKWLRPEGRIILDDYPDGPETNHPKKRLTWFLVEELKRQRVFVQKKKVFDTVFGVKGPGPLTVSKLEEIVEKVRKKELVGHD